ncbi:MAG: polysulfide reductase NrfD [Deltaproteobacteria bacterium]|nr:polysulfide reductase NrfD [Deltaproteobacteria bacterium]
MKAAESAPTFLIQPRLVHVWSELWHALAFSLTGTGGALYFYLVFTGIFQNEQRTAVTLVALTLVSLGALIIFTLEITYRSVFLRYFLTNIGQSWISRGVLGLFIFGILTIVSLLLDAFGVGSPIPGRALTIVAALAALVVVVYPSMVLSTAAIPFWRSSLLPLEFLVSSGIGGLAIIVLWQVIGDAAIPLRLPVTALASLLLINLILHLVHLASIPRSTRDKTIELLTVGKLRRSFLIGFLTFGIGTPLALGIVSYLVDEPGRSPLLLVAAILVLQGVFFQRYSVLRSGVKPALL